MPDARARSRRAASELSPAQPRLVGCLGLIARLHLQLLLQLSHQHVHQGSGLSGQPDRSVCDVISMQRTLC